MSLFHKPKSTPRIQVLSNSGLAATSGRRIIGSLALIGADANTKAASAVASW